MELFSKITFNIYLCTGVLSWFVAQVLKVVLTFITTKKISIERLLGNGGMPSSHSAFTVSIAVVIARTHGLDSAEFAIAVAFSLVVMTDAMGIRRAAGEQAKMLNKMVFEFSDIPHFFGFDKPKSVSVEVPLEVLEHHEKIGKEGETSELDQSDNEVITVKKLKELLGHTPLEVFGGLTLGIIIGLVVKL